MLKFPWTPKNPTTKSSQMWDDAPGFICRRGANGGVQPLCHSWWRRLRYWLYSKNLWQYPLSYP